MPITQQQFMNGPSTPGGTTVALTSADISAGAVGTPQLAANAVTGAKMLKFFANGKTGTGSSQSIPHGMGVVPSFVSCPLTGSTASQAVTYGTHTTTNIVVTVTTGATFDVIAFG
jgi:hypothetical protein